MENLFKNVEKVRRYWISQGHEEWKKLGLCPDSPIFKLIFNPSAGHIQVHDILKSGNWKEGNYFIVEDICRHIDKEKVGDNSHLSFFKMIGIMTFVSRRNSKEEIYKQKKIFIEKVLRFFQEYNIEPSQLLATFFGGGKILNYFFPEDKDTKEILKELGVKKLVSMQGRNSFLFRPISKRETSGYRSDFCFLQGNNSLEISTLDFCDYLNFNKEIIKNEEFVLFCSFIGVERLLSVSFNEDIWQLPFFAEMKNIVLKWLIEKYKYSPEIEKFNLLDKDVKIFIDRLRVVAHIVKYGQKADNTRRGQIFRQFLKDILRFSYKYLGNLDKDLCKNILLKIGKMDLLESSVVNDTLTALDFLNKKSL